MQLATLDRIGDGAQEHAEHLGRPAGQAVRLGMEALDILHLFAAARYVCVCARVCVRVRVCVEARDILHLFAAARERVAAPGSHSRPVDVCRRSTSE
jgi:hypothetical protein